MPACLRSAATCGASAPCGRRAAAARSCCWTRLAQVWTGRKRGGAGQGQAVLADSAAVCATACCCPQRSATSSHGPAPTCPASGTDPAEGSALGIALLRTLVRGGLGGAGLTVASTHHGALTALKCERGWYGGAAVQRAGCGCICPSGARGGAGQCARVGCGPARRGKQCTPATCAWLDTGMCPAAARRYEDERFENASVEFDEAALAPTYRCARCRKQSMTVVVVVVPGSIHSRRPPVVTAKPTIAKA